MRKAGLIFSSNNNISQRLFILTVILFSVQAINQKCVSSEPNSQLISNSQMMSYQHDLQQQQCPQHSYCASNHCCVCQANYVGDCSTHAQIPKNSPILYNLNQNYKFFILRPSEMDTRVTFQITVCDLQKVKQSIYTYNYWFQDGNLNKPDDSNGNGEDRIRLMNACFGVFFHRKFQPQPNGQHSSIIFGLKVNQINDLQATVQFDQKIQDNNQGIIKIIIIVASVVAALIIAIGVYCLYKRRKKNLKEILEVDQSKDFLTYFEQLMPQRKVNQGDFKGIHCVVCLGDFLKGQIVRKIICNHVFHVKCLNEYCQQQLSCPICKLPLDKDSLTEKINQSQKSLLSLDDNTMSQQLIKKYQESSQRIN